MADEPGDWAIHCHKSHHTMNAMGHDIRTFIGVDKTRVRQEDPKRWCPTTCRWARAGMADMGEMEMPLPDNTLPMMTGFAQFGAGRDGRHVLGREGARGPGRRTTTRIRAGTSTRPAPSPGNGRGRSRPPPRAATPTPAAKPGGTLNVVKPTSHGSPQVHSTRRTIDETANALAAALAAGAAVGRACPAAPGHKPGEGHGHARRRPTASRAIPRSRRASSRS